MAVSRALYITFFTLYLILLATSLWFLLYYSTVPYWVWFFFFVALLISFVSLIIRETAIKHIVTKKGESTGHSTMGTWGSIYIVMQILAMILIITGLIFVITYSSIPWWVWVILGVAIILNIIGIIIAALVPGGVVFSLIFAIIAFITFLVGFSFVVAYSESPWWVWCLFGISILFLILADVLEKISEKPKTQPDKIIVVASEGESPSPFTLE